MANLSTTQVEKDKETKNLMGQFYGLNDFINHDCLWN